MPFQLSRFLGALLAMGFYFAMATPESDVGCVDDNETAEGWYHLRWQKWLGGGVQLL